MNGIVKNAILFVLAYVIGCAMIIMLPEQAPFVFLCLGAVTTYYIIRPNDTAIGRSRRAAVIMLVFMAFPMFVLSIIEKENRQREIVNSQLRMIQPLRAIDPEKYLSSLKNINTELWLLELKKLDPKAYQAELDALVDEVSAQDADKRLEACGPDSETEAFKASQRFVRQNFTGTIDFPFFPESSIAMGDCAFKVESHVAARDHYGKTVRLWYSVIMFHHYQAEAWSFKDMRILTSHRS